MIDPLGFDSVFCNSEYSYQSMYYITGGYMVLLTLFGLYMAWKIKRPGVFRFKLAMIYSLPLLLAVTSINELVHISHTYRLMILFTFLSLLHVLYWRELKKMTTSIGYHKNLLVNFLDMSPDMVWMKDLENRFTYTNSAIRTGLLCCTEDEAYGKTGVELAEVQRRKGHRYTFGEVCCDSDEVTIGEGRPCRFLEFGEVNGRFLALQVFKAPLYVTGPDGKPKITGTIGMGRDLTYDFEDHERILKLLENKKFSEAVEVFKMHMDRYKFESPFNNVDAIIINGKGD